MEGPGVWCLEPTAPTWLPRELGHGPRIGWIWGGGCPLTWLGHRPLFALKQAAGRRQLADTYQVCGPGTELIEVAFAKVADLEEQRHRLKAETGGEGAGEGAEERQERGERFRAGSPWGFNKMGHMWRPGNPRPCSASGPPTVTHPHKRGHRRRPHSSLTLQTWVGTGCWLTGCHSSSSESCWSRK